MTSAIIITLCSLLLIAYLFDVTSSKTKIPSVIILLLLGWLTKQSTIILEINFPDLSNVLPILGTIGLILIVLEGSLELEFNSSKLNIVKKSIVVALLPILVLSFGIAYLMGYYYNIPLKTALINIFPISVISSAIAIPSAKNISSSEKEFITYESSLSDIFGVILFNFVALNTDFGTKSFGYFVFEFLLMIIISFASTLLLTYLLGKIKNHVKFIPIILIIILIYAVSKLYHLPALIFILFFGLIIGNVDELKHIPYIKKFHTEILNKEVKELSKLTNEITFLIRSLFFILFGFLIDTSELLNSETFIWSLGITISIFAVRYIFLKIFSLPTKSLLFFAPRGLITILLYLSIPINEKIELVNKSLIIQVIVLTALFMMIGLMINPTTKLKEKI